MQKIPTLFLRDETDKHPKDCFCYSCFESSEAIFQGLDEVSQNFPDSERKVKNRRPKEQSDG